ncbi:hypothetical protein PM082_016014 [Marasmius tenuissimus]|nr:hypothetical protein PM082_016014 [Marasmius tenuissimus]
MIRNLRLGTFFGFTAFSFLNPWQLLRHIVILISYALIRLLVTILSLSATSGYRPSQSALRSNFHGNQEGLAARGIGSTEE